MDIYSHVLKKVDRKPPTSWMLLCLNRTLHKKNTWNSNNGIPGIFFGKEEDFIEILKKGITFSLVGW